jgi:hypothetical protein
MKELSIVLCNNKKLFLDKQCLFYVYMHIIITQRQVKDIVCFVIAENNYSIEQMWFVLR